jgi:putative hydrolase of HD superfamily
MASFFYEIGAARRRKRAWEQTIGVPMANVAEHTLRVQVLALYLAHVEGADPAHAAMLALWHDATEIRGTDATPHQKPYVAVDEEKALAATVAGTPLAPMILAAYGEYKARETLAAKCVKDADILDTVLELMELKQQGYGYPRHPQVQQQIAIKREKYFTATARALHDTVTAEGAPSPWDWFLNGDSTFKQGTYGH